MARVTVTIAQESGGNLQLVKGATVKAYVYDTGQPNNRGTLLANLTETPSNSGQYVFDLSGTERIVVTADTGSGEANLPAWEGKKVWGTQATTDDYQDNSVTTVKLPDESITGAKCANGFLEQWHFTTDIVPAGAIEDAAFNTTEFEKIAGVFRHKANGTSGTNITDASIPDAKISALDGAKITDNTITPGKIVPESLTDNEMSDEILIARMFAADQVEAAHVNPTLMFNTTQFERSGSPAKWQLKADFLSTIDAGSVPYIVNVLDYGADTSGAGSSSQAFQDAFDAIGEEKGIVVIPPGTYLCKNLVVGANTWIWAHGATIVHDGTAPTGAPTGIFLLRSEGANISTPNNNIRIEGGLWRGNASLNGNIFDFIYCWNVKLQNCRFDTIKAFAISAVGCNYLNIDKCIDLSFASAGSVYLNQATNTTILNSSFVSNGKTIFFNGLTGANGSGNIVIENNNIVNASSSGHAFYIDESLSNVKIQNNYIVSGVFTITPGVVTNSLINVFIQHNLFSQIPSGSGTISVFIYSLATDISNVQFSNNTLVDCGRISFALQEIEICNNRIYDGFAAEGETDQDGYIIALSANIGVYNSFIIKNNLVKSTGFGSIYIVPITSAEMLEIKNNTTDNGIVVKKSSSGIGSVVIEQNRITGQLTNEEAAKILNNIIDATGETVGIDVSQSDAVLLENNIVTAGGTGIKVATSNNILYNNKCLDQTAYGIQLTAAADDNLVKGSIIRNPGTAATDDNGTGNTLTDNTTI